MTDEFSGPATPLAAADIAAAAAALGATIAHVKAVMDVETGPQGAFDRQKRPTILFERHYFSRLSNGRFDQSHPDLSAKTPGGYGKFSEQYPKLHRAIALNRKAALESASWGMFQVMGANHKLAGFEDVEDFVAAMASGEKAHLAALVSYVIATRLDGALRRGDWAAFARGYNGPGFAKNQYDAKLAAAFAKHGGAV